MLSTVYFNFLEKIRILQQKFRNAIKKKKKEKKKAFIVFFKICRQRQRGNLLNV